MPTRIREQHRLKGGIPLPDPADLSESQFLARNSRRWAALLLRSNNRFCHAEPELGLQLATGFIIVNSDPAVEILRAAVPVTNPQRYRTSNRE